MTFWIVLRNTDQVSLNWSISDVFLMIRVGLQVCREEAPRGKVPFSLNHK
jgi:hypothetical protein